MVRLKCTIGQIVHWLCPSMFIVPDKRECCMATIEVVYVTIIHSAYPSLHYEDYRLCVRKAIKYLGGRWAADGCQNDRFRHDQDIPYALQECAIPPRVRKIAVSVAFFILHGSVIDLSQTKKSIPKAG